MDDTTSANPTGFFSMKVIGHVPEVKWTLDQLSNLGIDAGAATMVPRNSPLEPRKTEKGWTGGNSKIFHFHPEPWEKIPIWDYFSTGLKPPTSWVFVFFGGMVFFFGKTGVNENWRGLVISGMIPKRFNMTKVVATNKYIPGTPNNQL